MAFRRTKMQRPGRDACLIKGKQASIYPSLVDKSV